MILIYSPLHSVRLNYVAKQLFKQLLGLSYEITDNKDAFLVAQGVRINYSDAPIEGSLQVSPKGLLFEESIEKHTPALGEWQGDITLYPSVGDVPFDIFSATFFLLSRYEEYTNKKRDHHGRFEGKESLAYHNNFLQLPIINIWADHLRRLFNEKLGADVPNMPYRYISTIDIDHIFYYKYKPFFRNALGAAKQLLSGDFENVTARIKTILGTAKDPNDIYAWLLAKHKKHNTTSVFFFYMGNKRLPYDPMPLYPIPEAADIISSLAKSSSVGIHPSYHSLNNKTIVLEEKERLESIIEHPVARSRQHFLRFNVPETYSVLENCGIENEYSMGYADVAGYRAGIASPFNWYDLEQNKETKLMVHPFAVMDVTLKNYMQLTTIEAITTLKQLNEPVRKHGGTFMSLWHNESLSEKGEWKNWRQVYELLLTFSAQNGN